MNIRILTLASLLGGAACGNAMALITPSTTGLTTTFFENFENSTSFSGNGRVPAGSDDYLWLSALAPSASFIFNATTDIASLTLDFWYSVPGSNNGQVSLTRLGSPAVLSQTLADTSGNALQFIGNNPGAATGGSNDFDGQFTTSFSDLLAGQYTLTFSKLGGVLNSFKVDDVNIAVTAVPEPETYALMLAGLALIGWIVRRRLPDRSLA